MLIEIREESPVVFEDYARISNSFEVTRIFKLTGFDLGFEDTRLVEQPVVVPYIKDYDAIPGNHPVNWPRRFDVSNWGIFSARIEGRLVGGAVVAFNTAGFDMLEDRNDLAVLWDLRVATETRRQGIASALFAFAEQWARVRGCEYLNVETQNINVAACEFYRSRGCCLDEINCFAYPKFPEEIQLIWRKWLRSGGEGE